MKLRKTTAIILILCLVISLFTACSKDYKTNQIGTKALITEDNYSKATNFLKTNYSSIDISDNNDFSSFKLLDSALEEKEVFFTSETHGVAANSELDIKFIKYFKEKAGIKYLLLELPYSGGQMLNKYLATGDKSILETMYKQFKGTFGWNKESYANWEKLYNFNKSLPENEKLKIIGIDIEHQYVNAIRFMNSLIPDKNAPYDIKALISKVNEICNTINTNQSATAAEEFSKELDESIKSNPKVYKEYFGEKLFDFELVNENIIAMVNAYKDDISFNQSRDAKMYDNFKKIYTRIPKGKFYGQWGLSHTFQKAIDIDWLASLMNSSDSPVKGKILSIVYLYNKCEYMNSNDNKTSKLTSYGPDEKILEPFTKDDITLFKLTGNASPFQQQLIWPFDINPNISMGNMSKPTKGVTTDYFQYMISIKNAKATTPLNK